MNKSAKVLESFKKWPLGLWAFSKGICIKAPYFSSISPVFTLLEPGRGEALVKKHRAVENHIGTVHAIAMANLCELVAGTTLEITVPPTHRWIPKSMKINYLKKANTDVIAKTVIDVLNWPDAGSISVMVSVYDTSDVMVVSADIEMYVSLKK